LFLICRDVTLLNAALLSILAPHVMHFQCLLSLVDLNIYSKI
jgi:hypothetical protein